MLKSLTHRFWMSVSILCLSCMMLGFGWLESIDSRTRLRSALVENSSGRLSSSTLTGAARGTAYQSLPRSNVRARASFRVGGVLIGREPEGWDVSNPKPWSVPDFEYEIHSDLEPAQVDLKFRDDAGEEWTLRVPAGVIHPATAVAVEGGVVLYTLTGSVDADTADAQGVGEVIDDTILHPALDDHRTAWLPAIADLYADNRGGRALSQDIQAITLMVAGMSQLLSTYESMAAGQAVDDDVERTLYASVFAYISGLELLSPMPMASLDIVTGAMGGAAQEDAIRRAHEIMAGVHRALTDNIEWNDEIYVRMFLGRIRNMAREKELGPDPLRFSGSILSAVEDRTWHLRPSDFSLDRPLTSLDEAPIQFSHRFAIQDSKQLANATDEDLATLRPIAVLRSRLNTSLHETLEPNDWVMLDTFARFVLVERLIRAVLEERITDFPVNQWERLLAETADLDLANHTEITLQALHDRTSRWHTASVMHNEDDEMLPAPPVLPPSWRLK